MIKPLFWENNRLYIVDQKLLPAEYKKIEIHNHIEMANAIKRLSIRGAPAIGIAAAFGLVLGLKPYTNASQDSFFSKLAEISDILRNTRPTAVNLSWALQRMKNLAQSLTGTPVPMFWEHLLT
jgi:methylthioribose-1-phosphate isomerase